MQIFLSEIESDKQVLNIFRSDCLKSNRHCYRHSVLLTHYMVLLILRLVGTLTEKKKTRSRDDEMEIVASRTQCSTWNIFPASIKSRITCHETRFTNWKTRNPCRVLGPDLCGHLTNTPIFRRSGTYNSPIPYPGIRI